MGRLKIPTQLSNYSWWFHIFFKIPSIIWTFMIQFDLYIYIYGSTGLVQVGSTTNQLRTGCSNKALMSAPWTKMVTPLTAWRDAAAAHKWRRCSSATRHRLQGLEAKASRGFTVQAVSANQRMSGKVVVFSHIFLCSSLLGEDYPI